MIHQPIDIQDTQLPSTNYWVGEKYHYNSDQQSMVADFLIKQHLFKDTDWVLDIGCGDGKITARIGKKLTKGGIIGVDPSESMINFAQKEFGKNHIKFQIGKASTLSFENQFDVITSFSSLHWEPKQKDALLCFKKALKPGGTILLAIPGPDLQLRKVLQEICNEPKWVQYFENYQSPGRIWTTNEYAQLLLEVGFIIKKIELVTRSYVFYDEKNYVAFLEAMLPHMTCLPAAQHESFLKDILHSMRKINNIDEKGGIIFEVKVLEIIANA